jgi:NAD(P)H-dependent FMN reductase
MEPDRPLFIPVILGTTRKGRMSETVARVVHRQVSTWPGVVTALVDIAALPIATNDAGEMVKVPEYAEAMKRADAVIIVTPEYNHGCPGMLKHVLDSCLEEYIHKAAGIVGVSAGPWGGTRVIEGLLPVLRELGLVTIFWDVQFPSVRKALDERGELRDSMQLKRIDKFLAELVWMAKTLRHGRETVALETR